MAKRRDDILSLLGRDEPVGEDPFVNGQRERVTVILCPECWSSSGWDKEAGWCYDCGTHSAPITGFVYTSPRPSSNVVEALKEMGDTVSYCADRLERMPAPVLHGGKHMISREDVMWAVRKLNASDVKATAALNSLQGDG